MKKLMFFVLALTTVGCGDTIINNYFAPDADVTPPTTTSSSPDGGTGGTAGATMPDDAGGSNGDVDPIDGTTQPSCQNGGVAEGTYPCGEYVQSVLCAGTQQCTNRQWTACGNFVCPMTDAGVVPGSGTFSFCKVGISDGCCTTGAFKQGIGKPLSTLLIKRPAYPLVYYVGSDGKRYVFPTKDSLVSWYEPDDSQNFLNGTSDICQTVVEYPEETIANMLIGGNVTIRPGTYILRIGTDPQLYGIARHKTIRPIGKQLPDGSFDTSLINQLFLNASQRVRVLSDAFFTNYQVGTPVTNLSDYNPEMEYDWGAPVNMERELGILP